MTRFFVSAAALLALTAGADAQLPPPHRVNPQFQHMPLSNNIEDRRAESENQPTWDTALANKDNPPPPEPALEPPRTPEEALLRKQQEDQAREIVKDSGLEDAARAFFGSEEFQSLIREARADLLKQHYLRRPKQGLDERVGKRPTKSSVD